MSASKTSLDIWSAINHEKPKDMHVYEWKHSFIGVKKALLFINLILEMTQDEFNNTKVPLNKDGFKAYNRRKVIVSHNGILKEPRCIENLLRKKEHVEENNNEQSKNVNNNSDMNITDIWNIINNKKPKDMHIYV